MGWGVLNGLSGCSVPALRASFSTTFLKIMVLVKASRLPHVLKLWLVVSKGMLPVKYFRSNNASLCQLNFTENVRLS